MAPIEPVSPTPPRTPPRTPPPTPSGPPSGAPGPFEFSGGALCLDFVNSWGDRGRLESDQLKGFGDLVAFVSQAGLVDERNRLELLADAEGAAALAAFEVARELRQSLYCLFTAGARGHACLSADVETLNGVLREALAHLQVEVETADAEATFRWRFAPSDLAIAPLWPIARSAADLLASPDFARVTQCDGSRCTWLFLDQSRTRNRRWCSMQSCGNRAKARRHYHRSKSEP